MVDRLERFVVTFGFGCLHVTMHIPDETKSDNRDAADIAEDFVNTLSRIPCQVEPQELMSALETLAELSGETVSVDDGILIWQAVTFLSKARGGRLPDRYRL